MEKDEFDFPEDYYKKIATRTSLKYKIRNFFEKLVVFILISIPFLAIFAIVFWDWPLGVLHIALGSLAMLAGLYVNKIFSTDWDKVKYVQTKARVIKITDDKVFIGFVTHKGKNKETWIHKDLREQSFFSGEEIPVSYSELNADDVTLGKRPNDFFERKWPALIFIAIGLIFVIVGIMMVKSTD